MNLFAFTKDWKKLSKLWEIIAPIILKLIEKKVPNSITKLYENFAKYTQKTVDSLLKLKSKIKETPNELDDYCFCQGVCAIENLTNYLLDALKKLKN